MGHPLDLQSPPWLGWLQPLAVQLVVMNVSTS
jgi:hypothetical protein